MLLYDLMVFVISKILSVTLSGAGPPFDTLYLIPKSAARNKHKYLRGRQRFRRAVWSSWIVRSGEKDTASRLSSSDDVRHSWSGEDTVLADQKFLDTYEKVSIVYISVEHAHRCRLRS